MLQHMFQIHGTAKRVLIREVIERAVDQIVVKDAVEWYGTKAPISQSIEGTSSPKTGG